jgi:diaminopimelate decarboxylase
MESVAFGLTLVPVLGALVKRFVETSLFLKITEQAHSSLSTILIPQNVGGPSASFGIWHELIPEVHAIVAEHRIVVERIHTHIGSGSDPDIWQKVSIMSLNLVRQFPDVVSLNLGGGFKVGRMSYEASTDLQAVAQPVKEAFGAFAAETGREIKLEIEPGTFLVANAGALLTTVQDIVATGEQGYTFLKLDSGMTEVLRPSLYVL